MGASAQLLKDTLQFTSACLTLRSASDLECTLEWLANIAGASSILVLGVQQDSETKFLANAAYHSSKKHSKCSEEAILDSPLFKQTQHIADHSGVCLPPCGGLGTYALESNESTKLSTSLLLVSDNPTSSQLHQDICSFVLPHISHAIQRYAELSQKSDAPQSPILSPREEDVLVWISQGKSNWETGRILGISENTVKFHVANICKKLDVRKRGHAIAKASQLNLIAI